MQRRICVAICLIGVLAQTVLVPGSISLLNAIIDRRLVSGRKKPILFAVSILDDLPVGNVDEPLGFGVMMGNFVVLLGCLCGSFVSLCAVAVNLRHKLYRNLLMIL